MKKKLKDIATVQMGYSFRSRLENMREGDTAVIQMKDLSEDNIVDCRDLVRINMDGVKKHHLAGKGDLIFRSRGSVFTSAILLEEPGNAVVAAPLLRIRVKKNVVIPEYLNWFISQPEAQSYFASRTEGTVQKMISLEALVSLEVFIPNIEKQKQIAELSALSYRESKILKTLACARERYVSALLMRAAKGEK